MKFKSQEELDEYLICTNSIERVINTTIKILENIPKPKDEHLEELISVNHEDWSALKTLTVKLWNEKRNDIFIKRMKEEKK